MSFGRQTASNCIFVLLIDRSGVQNALNVATQSFIIISFMHAMLAKSLSKNESVDKKVCERIMNVQPIMAFVDVYFKLRSEFHMRKIQISIDWFNMHTNEWMTHVHTPSIIKSARASRAREKNIYSRRCLVCGFALIKLPFNQASSIVNHHAYARKWRRTHVPTAEVIQNRTKRRIG